MVHFQLFSVLFLNMKPSWTSLLEPLGSLWKPLAHHGRLWAHFGDPWAALGFHFGCLGTSLGAPLAHLGDPWVHFRKPWAFKTHPKWSRIVFRGHSEHIRELLCFHGFEGLEAPRLAQNAILGAWAAQIGCPEALAAGFTWIYRDLGRSRSDLSGFDWISGISGVQGPESLATCGALWPGTGCP
jgi:hypothetical protein